MLLFDVRPSPIHGVGAFAKQDLDIGTVVLVNNVIDPEPSRAGFRGFNHSNNPNVRHFDPEWKVVRLVRQGEELTVDYYTV
jgi:hypothetical protein